MTPLQEKTINSIKSGKTYKKIAEELNCNIRTVERIGAKYNRNRKTASENLCKPGDEVAVDLNDSSGNGSITTKSLNIKTLEDALRASKIDLEIWEADRHLINSWEVTMGGDKTPDGIPQTYTNYQVKVWLKRRVKNLSHKIIESLISRDIKSFKTDVHVTKKLKSHFLVVSLYDHHFGMMAWGKETVRDYDLKIAADLYIKAVKSLVEKAKGFDVDTICLPIGNDFFHINDSSNVTPKGKNPLDVDNRLIKVYETGYEAVLKSIDYLLGVANVKIVWVPGNHDPQTSYFLCKTVEAYYKNYSNIEVDASPRTRKYHRFGNTLIGWTHGDEERVDNLPLLMANETKGEWAMTTSHEWHIGHLHKKKESRYISGDTVQGVYIRQIPSLSSADAWHYKKGFIKADSPAAEAYMYDKDTGYTAHFSVNLRDLQ